MGVHQFPNSKSKNEDGLASGGNPPYDGDMNVITKDLLEAKLETIETRMDGRLRSIEDKIDTKFAQMDTKFSQFESSLIKWILGTAIGLGAVAITIMTFVLNNAVPKVAATQPQSSAPVIIQMPSPTPQQLPAKP